MNTLNTMHKHSKHQLSSISRIAYLIGEDIVPTDIPSDELLKERIRKASTTLLSTELPEEEVKDLAKSLKAKYERKRIEAPEQRDPRKTRLGKRILSIALVLLDNVTPPSKLEIEDSLERSVTALGLELEYIDGATLTKELKYLTDPGL